MEREQASKKRRIRMYELLLAIERWKEMEEREQGKDRREREREMEDRNESKMNHRLSE